MKFVKSKRHVSYTAVTPYAGVWIEIRETLLIFINILVTPYAGVWIEISGVFELCTIAQVTPYAGVWIEIVPRIWN